MSGKLFAAVPGAVTPTIVARAEAAEPGGVGALPQFRVAVGGVQTHGAVDDAADRVVVGDAHPARQLDQVGIVGGRVARPTTVAFGVASTHFGPFRAGLRTWWPHLVLGTRDERGRVEGERSEPLVPG